MYPSDAENREDRPSTVSESEPAAEHAAAAAPAPSAPVDIAEDGDAALGGETEAPNGAPPESSIPKKHGPAPATRLRVRDTMLAELGAGGKLPEDQQVSRALQYGVSRDTWRRARKEALEIHEREQSLSELSELSELS
jgi:hypothetical protein